ncbi:MAG TPA: DNA-binding response regulator [Mariprofundaceae bacterium]|nr:DNA-binding response regulator [Mariprofundaceae bacterium]
MTKKKCIILCASACIGRQITSLLEENCGWKIYMVHSGTQAYARLSKDSIDVVVADIEAPALGGLEFLEYCHRHYTRLVTYGLAPENNLFLQKLATATGGCLGFFYQKENSAIIDCNRGAAAIISALRYSLLSEKSLDRNANR